MATRQLFVIYGGGYVRREEKAGRLGVLAQMAMNDPQAWLCLLREIEEVQWMFERMAGRVNVEQDPVSTHGKQCYNSGAAKGLETLRWFLRPETLNDTITKLTDPLTRRTT